MTPGRAAQIPRHLLAALAVYCAASLIHFVHNAQYIGEYPNLPAWLTRSKVYLAWLAITSVGAAGVLLLKRGRRLAGLVLVAVYAALGFAGLDHYWLAAISAHSSAMNATIAFEVTAAAIVFAISAVLVFHRVRPTRDG